MDKGVKCKGVGTKVRSMHLPLHSVFSTSELWECTGPEEKSRDVRLER